jgi:hypothetical protein
MVLADAKVLFELLNAAGNWLQKAVSEARKQRDQRAAHVLHDAFVVVAAMRAYDNAFRPMLGELLAFSDAWEADRRQRLSEELFSFFDVEQILPQFRQAFQGIESSHWDGAGREALGQLIGSATTFADEIVGEVWKEKENFMTRARLSRALEYGGSPDDEKAVHDWAEATAKILDRHLLAEADNAFGELRQAILAAHKLPDPGYAVSLSGIERPG